MKNLSGFFKKKGSWIYVVVLIIILGIVYAIASLNPVPIRLITDYPASMLLEEGQYMHECAECHDFEDFHMCDTCHNEHGSADLANLNFYSVLHVTGDVPEEKYYYIYQMFSKRNEEINKINIFDFVEDAGVDEFESITFCTNDRGFSTITKENLGETSYLLPYEEGMRFADEALHVSTWLKGVNKIIIVTGEENLWIDGIGYSFGELLLSDTVQFTVEQAAVMLANEDLGTMKTGSTATRLEGVELKTLTEINTNDSVLVKNVDGINQIITGEEALNAKLSLIGEYITLVFPEKGRGMWISGVESIEVIK